MTISKTLAVAASSVGVLVIGGGIAAAAALSGGSGSAGVPAGDQITQSTSAAPVVAAVPTSTAPVVSSPVATPTVRSLTKHATVKQQEVTVTQQPTTSDQQPTDTEQPVTDTPAPGAPARHGDTGTVINDPYASATATSGTGR